jgi:hypothetical protein
MLDEFSYEPCFPVQTEERGRQKDATSGVAGCRGKLRKNLMSRLGDNKHHAAESRRCKHPQASMAMRLMVSEEISEQGQPSVRR